VQVLQHQQTATVAGSGSQEAQQPFGERDHRVFCKGVSLPAPLRYEATQNRPERIELRRVRRAPSPNKRTERLSEGPVGLRRVGLHGAPPQNRHPAMSGVAGNHVGEPRLTNPSLTYQEHRAPPPVDRRIQPVAQGNQLSVTADHPTRQHRLAIQRRASGNAHDAHCGPDRRDEQRQTRSLPDGLTPETIA
jgi:hypothetical protein